MSERLPDGASSAEPGDELTVQVLGGGGEPERLLRISRPVGGLVRVLEWTSESWNAPPLEREMAVEALLGALEEAAAQRRRISQEMYRIRTWLTDGV